MNRTPHTLVALIFVLSSLPGCLFTVDTEMQDSEPTPDTGVDAADTGSNDVRPTDTDIDPNDVDDDVSVSIDGPTPDNTPYFDLEFSIEYELDCQPQGCEELLHCQILHDGETGDYAPCSSPFVVTDDDVGEGYHQISVALINDEDTLLAEDSHTNWVRYPLAASIEDLSPTTLFSHAALGHYTIDCDHPHCTVSCQWDLNDETVDAGCELDALFALEIPPQSGTNVPLKFEACSSTDFTAPGSDTSTSYCVEETYAFHYTDPQWIAVDLGSVHSCAILADHTLWCWGSNETQPGQPTGQLGLGEESPPQVAEPHRVTTGDDHLTWLDVGCGLAHTCAISTDNDLFCWGENISEITGDVHSSPVLIDDEHTWTATAAGSASSCALTAEDKLYCWGSDLLGVLGRADPEEDELNEVLLPDESDPDLDPIAWTDVAIGSTHACAVAENGVPDPSSTSFGSHVTYCWGHNNHNQVAPSTSQMEYETPELVGDPLLSYDTLSVSAGSAHSCAIAVTDTSTEALCWGENEGQLGWQDGEEHEGPWYVADSTDVEAITAGGSSTCALDNQSQAKCWGNNDFYALGTGDDTSAMQPVAVDFSEHVDPGSTMALDAITTSGGHTCAIDADHGSLYCWGTGETYALGLGDDDDASTPKPISWPHSR